METKTTYTVSETTRRYLDVLDTYQAFRNQFLTALQAEYGDDGGDKLYNSHAETLDAVELVFWQYLRVPLTWEMGIGKKEITI